MRTETEVLANEEGRPTTEVTGTPLPLQPEASPASDAKVESTREDAGVASELREQVCALADARAIQAQHDEMVKAARAEFSAHFAPLLLAQKAAADGVAKLDASVRALALVEYGATQEKAVAPGVSIRMRATLIYTNGKALEWAKEKGMALIPESLDVIAFEKIAKATELPFVIYAEAPEVTIASKLQEALAVAEVSA